MATLTYAQLEGLWIANGGNKTVAPLAAAIAMAESSGSTTVTSANPDGGTNVGLWQLDTKGKGAGHTVKELQDPATNAAVTVQATRNGTDWSAWQTYVTGAYKRFMSGSTTPDMNVPTSATLTSAGTTGASAGPDCAFSIGGQHIGIVFGHGPSLPSACIIRKTEVRALLGGLIMAAGALITLPGLVIVMAYGFRATGAASAAVQAAGAVPGYGRAIKATKVGGAQKAPAARGRPAQPTTRTRRGGGQGAGQGAGKGAKPPPPPVVDPAVEGADRKRPPSRVNYG